jgi:hypothetical protein
MSPNGGNVLQNPGAFVKLGGFAIGQVSCRLFRQLFAGRWRSQKVWQGQGGLLRQWIDPGSASARTLGNVESSSDTS